jgi:ADP-sugar diphosphatase
MPTTFQLSAWEPAIPVTVADGHNLDEKKLLGFPAFRNWLEGLQKNLTVQTTPGHTFEKDPWRLEGVNVHNVTVFENGRIGFMTIEALMKKSHISLDRVIFLRGGTVAILMILRPKDNSTAFLEIPAGMLDNLSGSIVGKAMERIYEETRLRVRSEELIDLTAMALEKAETNEQLKNGVYMSPGNLDEYMPMLLWEKYLDRKELEGFKSRLAGEVVGDELITLRIRNFEVLWKEGARDAKTLAAWALYDRLGKTEQIEERLKEIRLGRTQG